MGFATLIEINGIVLPESAARGITQTIEPIEASAHQRETINGTRRDLGAVQFRKYRSTLSCDDQKSPYLRDVWPGNIVVLKCLPELIGPGSSAADDPLILTMMVASPWKVKNNEWGAAVGWEIDLMQVQGGL